jgi:hypothetical protein
VCPTHGPRARRAALLRRLESTGEPLSKGRMEGFSDGVFGFAITLLPCTVLHARPAERLAHGRFARPR